MKKKDPIVFRFNQSSQHGFDIFNETAVFFQESSQLFSRNSGF